MGCGGGGGGDGLTTARLLPFREVERGGGIVAGGGLFWLLLLLEDGTGFLGMVMVPILVAALITRSGLTVYGSGVMLCGGARLGPASTLRLAVVMGG